MRIRGVFLVGGATIAIAAPAFAQIPDPTKHLPAVPVPTVQVPVPTVQVPIPTVQVPVPTVQVPVPVPTVQAPIPVPKVPVPTAPVTGGGGQDGAGGGGSAGGSGSGGSGSGSGGSGGGGSGSAGSGGGGSGSGSGSNSGAGGSGGVATGSGATKSASGSGAKASSGPRVRIAPTVPTLDEADLRRTGPVKRERRLRETVARATGCLDDLSRGQRRVLTLRAGVDERPARSRMGVAKRLDISVKRVARLEIAGLRRLRTLAGRGACAAETATTVTSAAVTTTDAFATEPAATKRRTGEDGGASGGGESDPPAAGGVDPPATEAAGGVEGATRSNRPAASQTGGVDLVVPLIVLLIAGFTLVVGRAVKRELAAPVADPEPEPAEPTPPPAPSARWDEPPPGLDR